MLANIFTQGTLMSMRISRPVSLYTTNAKFPARKGFSLVEIIITVLLVSILSAVAVPRLLTFRDNAGDSAAQQQLRTVSLVARSLFDSTDSFVGVAEKLVEPPTGGADRLPEIVVVAANGSTIPTEGVKSKKVSVFSGTGADATFIAASPGGNKSCWFIKLSARTADSFAVALTTPENCNANSAPVPASLDWKANDFPPTPPTP